MQRFIVVFTVFCLVTGCKQRNAPDVSNIQVQVKIERFDKFLFEKADTTDMSKTVAQLQSAFPYFTNDFITHIVGLPGITAGGNDSVRIAGYANFRRFLSITRILYDSISPGFTNTGQLEVELTKAFKYVRYYFPEYRVPRIVTYIGPFDAPGVAITSNALAIGLQLYAGSNFSYYTSAEGQEIYPLYLSRRFTPQYIVPNCMKAVADDIYPDKSNGRPLIEEMIEKGKEWYLADKFLPETADSLKTGFTGAQLRWSLQNEGLIWNFFLESNDLYTTEPSVIKNYLGEAPNTEGMPEASPGNIGQWVGWRIVNTYADKHPGIKPAELLRTEARVIFSEARYKPR